MKAVYKQPGQPAEIIEIRNELRDLQQAVGGYIEAVTLRSDVVLLCNEEGRLRGLPHNLKFFGHDFVGPLLLVGTDGEEFCDLPHPTFWKGALSNA